MYYFYRKSNRGHGICPLYRGCPPFGESVTRGFTVIPSSLLESIVLDNSLMVHKTPENVKINGRLDKSVELRRRAFQ